MVWRGQCDASPVTFHLWLAALELGRGWAGAIARRGRMLRVYLRPRTRTMPGWDDSAETRFRRRRRREMMEEMMEKEIDGGAQEARREGGGESEPARRLLSSADIIYIYIYIYIYTRSASSILGRASFSSCSSCRFTSARVSSCSSHCFIRSSCSTCEISSERKQHAKQQSNENSLSPLQSGQTWSAMAIADLHRQREK
jgi:hypothetical protein